MNDIEIEKAKGIVAQYCQFTDDAVYIILMMPRKKENAEDCTQREQIKKCQRYVIQNQEDADYAIEELERYASLYPTVTFRMYLGVNRRSLLKALRGFQEKIIDLQYQLVGGARDAYTKIARIGSEWKSVLANSGCKYDKNWMFDIDLCNKTQQKETQEFKEYIETMTETLYFGNTKSGSCLVVKPFDLRPLLDKENPKKMNLPDDIELKKDAYISLACLNDS